jgi:hypothetical protein
MTQVCITVDVEFSIGGAFAAPDRNEPIGPQVVTCSVGGREYGLGFILETLRAYGLTATFFVEALNSCYFGDGPMATIAERILKAGHDVQLHLHPCWLYFRQTDWKKRIAIEPPTDSCAGRTDAELDEMLSVGLETFRRWGVPTPVALRTGNLQVDLAVYRAMTRHGFRLSSNVACAIFRPTDPCLRLLAGHHHIEGIVELPVLTYRDLSIKGWRHHHNLTIAGTSFQEIELLLEEAHRTQLEPVVLLTHTFEFVNRHNKRYTKLRPHGTNQTRLARLCRFLAEEPNKYSVIRFSDGKDAWIDDHLIHDVELSVPLWATLSRLFTGRIDDGFRVR